MNLSIQLSGGDYVLATDTADKITLELLDPSLTPLSNTATTAHTNDWIDLWANNSGGFTLFWQDPAGKTLWAQNYDASVQTVSTPYVVTSPPPAALQAFPGSATGLIGSPAHPSPAVAYLNDDGTPAASGGGGGGGSGPFVIQKASSSGAAVGPAFTVTPQSGESIRAIMVAPTAETGGYVAAWVDAQPTPSSQSLGVYNETLMVAKFSGSGQLESEEAVTTGQSGPQGRGIYTEGLVGLADGGLALAYAVGPSFGSLDGNVTLAEFSAQGNVVASQSFGQAAVLGLNALPDGRYAITLNSTTAIITEQGAPLGTADPAPPPASSRETIVLGAATPLTPSAGWTSAAVLSNHALAVVDAQSNGNGWLQGAEQTYDANGNQTASTSLMGGGQALTPQITALSVGGFYEVTYAGSSNYEVYNANDQMVFAHNQWTSPTEILSPLANGGYITTDSSSGGFGLFDANNTAVGWFAMPADAPSGTPTVNALNGGGFVFTYAGTNHFDLYGASGNLLEGGAFSASGSPFAQGFAPLAGSGDGFVEAWLSPDGSTYNGVATALDIQAMGPHGAITPAITLAQDLDPWGTTFKLESHADGSAAVLWSQGGAVFGAEYANGQAGPAHGALPGDLSTTVAVQLPNDLEGFAWIMNGDAWAEIFNPATGQVQSADLGPSSSTDISTVHALATAQGGLAVSWREASGVMGAVIDASGQLATMPGLAGDLLGVDAAGQAVTLHDNGGGTPLLQTYTLNDGLFWAH